MKYLLMIWSEPDMSRALPDHEPLSEVIGAGELVAAEALADPLTARCVRVRDGEALVTDGPFVASGEWLAGYVIVDCATPERAEQIAGRLPDARSAAVEVRPLMIRTAEDL